MNGWLLILKIAATLGAVYLAFIVVVATANSGRWSYKMWIAEALVALVIFIIIVAAIWRS